MRHCSDRCRFYSKVKVGAPNDCWQYLGCTRKGYGAFGVGHRMVQAHRFAYELNLDCALSTSNDVLHSCDNPTCCNPAHLRLGSDLDNAADRVKRNRQAKGDQNGRAKLLSDDVRYIRRLPLTIPRKAIAQIYGISLSQVRAVQLGWNWKDVGS